MPFVSQAVAVKSSIENHQKTRENEVKQKQYLRCNICENVILTQEDFKKHYNEIHHRSPPKPIQKYSQEGELCTIL